MRAIDCLRSWNRIRVAINRVIDEDNPAAVERVLRQYPAESRRVVERATAQVDRGALWHGLLLTVGLARCEVPEAVDLLRRLTRRDFPDWQRLDKEALCSLRRYLLGRGEDRLFYTVCHRLDDRQFAWVLPDVASRDFLDVFKRSDWERRLDSIVQHIADFVEEIGLGKRSAGHGLDNAAEAATILWNRNCTEEALQLWTLIAIAEPGLFKDRRRLRPVAEALPGWIPHPGSSVVSLPDGSSVTMPLLPLPPPCVVRAADLLADFPHTDWIDPLRRTWLAVDDLVRRDARDEEPERDPRRLMPAQSIAAALGACAALDRQMRVLVYDEAGRMRRYEALRRDVEQRNQLVERHYKLCTRYQAGEEVVEAIQKLQDEIGRRDEAITSAHEALREELTPAALLLHTVNDGQAYPTEVRQGAAWGLYCILKDGVLDTAARDQVRKTLYTVMHDEEFDESTLRDRIAAKLPQGDPRIRELLAAADRYADNCDDADLDATVHRLVPEVPSLPQEIRGGVDTSRRSWSRDEFGERVLRLLPGARLFEFVGVLRRGLRWMVELVEEHADSNDSRQENLPWIAALIGEELPGVMDFLSHYPLRLMTLGRHRQILGQYSRDKVKLEYWTRYTPPRWFRGANPDELGEVHRRYLNLDDRSAPNAMGLYYRLFEHPVLVLPVLYHEFMHYGGPQGDPEHGIENETEVLLREILFARHLLAQLAPKEDVELPAYERALTAAIERTELVGLARQLFFKFNDDEYLGAINEQIVHTYGEGLAAAAARAEVDKKIEVENRNIELKNRTDEAKRFWYPEIDWPRLGTPETRALTDHLRTVLGRALQQDHRLDAKRRDMVLAEPVCRSHCAAWSAYRERDGALAQFAQNFSCDGLHPLVLQTIMHRFELGVEFGDPHAMFTELFRRAFTAMESEDS